MLQFEDVIKKPKTFRAMTSLDAAEFLELSNVFETAWHEYRDQQLREKDQQEKPIGGRRPVLLQIEDKLFFILFYLKLYPLQEIIAYLFGMSQSQSNYWIHTLSQVLKMALERDGFLPQRMQDELKDLLEQETGQDIQDMALDGTERRRQRPKEDEAQKLFYSGKKKAHTVKNVIVVGVNDRQIKYLGSTHEGKKHDKKIVDEEEPKFPEGTPLYQDSGLQGYHPDGVIIFQPKKKPRHGELTTEEKEGNRLISSVRVVVEHVISGIKRCRILKDVFRNTKEKFDDLAMEIACGLHNFRSAHRLTAY